MLNRTLKPNPKGEITFNLPDVNSFELDNSLKVYHVNKSTLPIIQINLLIPAGSIYCSDDKLGLAALTSLLIDEGAGNLTGLEISDRIEILGSILNISSNKEYVTISLLTLKENINKSLEIISLILQTPNFNDSDFKREHQRLKTQILQLNDDPSYLASTEFNRIVYSSTQFGFPANGTTETINPLTNCDVKEYFNSKYKPNGAFLIVVGDIEKLEIEEKFNNYFYNWETKNQSPLGIVAPKLTKKKIVLIDKPDAAQSEIRAGHLSKSRTSIDFFARSLLNSILGGQFSSRINLNLREDKGYTYGAHSNYSYNQIGSSFIVSTSVKGENTADSIKEILFELENVKNTIKEEEIEFSKSYLIRRYPSLFETYTQVSTNISLIPIFNLNDNYFENYTKNIERTTLQNVTNAANEAILLNNLVIVIVGDEKKIGKELKELAKLEGFDFLVQQ